MLKKGMFVKAVSTGALVLASAVMLSVTAQDAPPPTP